MAVVFFYKKSLAGCISICSTGSKRVNAIVVQLVDGQLLLIANVYFPTYDGTVSSKVNLNHILGELEGLLASQQFDYLLVVGDFNMDISPTIQSLLRHIWILLTIIL